MTFIEDRDGLDFDGNNPWKGYPVAIVEPVRLLISDRSGVSLDRILPNTQLLADLGIDSISFVELMMSVEEEFPIAIPDEVDVQLFITVSDLVQFVKDRTG